MGKGTRSSWCSGISDTNTWRASLRQLSVSPPIWLLEASGDWGKRIGDLYSPAPYLVSPNISLGCCGTHWAFSSISTPCCTDFDFALPVILPPSAFHLNCSHSDSPLHFVPIGLFPFYYHFDRIEKRECVCLI